jgi:hypothetical protein
MPEPGGTVTIALNREVDLLFVIDNTGSIAEEQARLTKAIAALIAPLEDGNVKADYRIGVTTTDSGNPRCPSAMTTPEGGNLVLSSCLDRVDAGEFTFNSEDFSVACTDFCAKRDSDLQVLPTSTAVDPQKVPRKWIERSGGTANVTGADLVEALQCYLPQGVAGCGFESHLESMYLALAGAQSPQSKNNFGFLRDQAQLAVVIVSDETDCSYAPAHKDVFTANKVFWNDPDVDVAPTSAMCWRAGVQCTGGAGIYSECHAENFDDQGDPGASDSDAVLQSVGKYIDFVKSIEANKQKLDEKQRVKVSLLTGVPDGYETFDKEIAYADLPPNEDFQLNFGIGPGCVLGDPNLPEASAVPPVREREFAEAFADSQQRRLYSLCQDSYSAALQTISKEIADAMGAACMPNCVRDVDPQTPVVDANCELRETDIMGDETVIPKCVEVNGVWTVPDGANLCYAQLIDKTGSETVSKIDDMSAACLSEGFNLEFGFVRTQPPAPGATIQASCELSANKAMDCPNL